MLRLPCMLRMEHRLADRQAGLPPHPAPPHAPALHQLSVDHEWADCGGRGDGKRGSGSGSMGRVRQPAAAAHTACVPGAGAVRPALCTCSAVCQANGCESEHRGKSTGRALTGAPHAAQEGINKEGGGPPEAPKEVQPKVVGPAGGRELRCVASGPGSTRSQDSKRSMCAAPGQGVAVGARWHAWHTPPSLQPHLSCGPRNSRPTRKAKA